MKEFNLSKNTLKDILEGKFQPSGCEECEVFSINEGIINLPDLSLLMFEDETPMTNIKIAFKISEFDNFENMGKCFTVLHAREGILNNVQIVIKARFFCGEQDGKKKEWYQDWEIYSERDNFKNPIQIPMDESQIDLKIIFALNTILKKYKTCIHLKKDYPKHELKREKEKNIQIQSIKNYEYFQVDTGEIREYVRRCESWNVRGHYRHYKDGKIVWISSHKKGKGKIKDSIFKI